MSSAFATQPEMAVFDRVIVGVDGSPEAIEAARQACRLAPGRPIILVCAVDTLQEPARAREIPALAHLIRDQAAEALAEARAQVEAAGAGPIDTTVEEGHPSDVLRYATGGDTAALVAVGTRGEGIPGGPASPASRYLERVALQIVGEVPCSVLVSRTPTDPAAFPGRITVGLDGSSAAAYAYAVASHLAAVTGAQLRYVIALGGKGADLEAVAAAVPEAPLAALDRRHPLGALMAAAQRSDLLVVGNRGLHGLRALGSISERIVARAPTSVLVVRGP